MKTINEIRNLTKQSLIDQEGRVRLAEIMEAARLKKERRERMEHAKDVSFFIKEIEKAAREGENTYSISLGKNEGSEYYKLHVKSISKLLKDFTPKFEDFRDSSCSYNYDGDVIDGTEKYHTSTRVTFNW